MPSETALQIAFNTSHLPRLGYTFEHAMANKALAICLNRLAEIKAKSAPVQKTYWYQKL